MIAVITGSTGLVGAELLKELLEDDQFTHIISVSRKSLNLNSDKLTEVIVEDFHDLSAKKEKLKGNVYFCCLGTTMKSAGSKKNFRSVDHDAVLEFAKVAKYHNAESFILISAQGANPGSFIFYNKVKGETERDLKVLGFQRLVIMRPGLLLGQRNEFRLAEKITETLAKVLSPVIPAKALSYVATPVGKLSRRMIEESKLRKTGLSIFESSRI